MIFPALSGDLGKAVQDAWKPFAAHMGQCSQCEVVELILKLGPDDPFPYYDACCGAGQALFVVWADTKMALIARLHELTAPWGMEGLVGAEAAERSDAIVAMPGPAAAELFRERNVEKREAVIRALIAAHRAGGVRTGRVGEEERRQCGADDCATGPYGSHGSFAVRADRPRQRYCCEVCRARDRKARRPGLVSMEE